MTLRSRSILLAMLPMIGTLALAVVAMAGLQLARSDYSQATQLGRQQLFIARVGSDLVALRALQQSGQTSAAAYFADRVISSLNDDSDSLSLKERETLLERLRERTVDSVNQAYGLLAQSARERQLQLQALDSHLEKRHQMAMFVTATSSIAVIAITAGLSWLAYRKLNLKSRQLVQSERLASVGYLAAGVAHEINNPLSIITGYGERSMQLISRLDADKRFGAVESAITVMCEEAYRCKQITDGLLRLSRSDARTTMSCDLKTAIEEVTAAVTSVGRFAGRAVTLSFHGNCLVRGVPSELKQVILNLLINALDATAQNQGVVRLEVTQSGAATTVSVRDSGCGMDRSTLDKAFEPFFTSHRNASVGNGLGLSVVRSIVHEHGGTVTANSAGVGKGSVFTVTLPRVLEGCDAQRN